MSDEHYGVQLTEVEVELYSIHLNPFHIIFCPERLSEGFIKVVLSYVSPSFYTLTSGNKLTTELRN